MSLAAVVTLLQWVLLTAKTFTLKCVLNATPSTPVNKKLWTLAEEWADSKIATNAQVAQVKIASQKKASHNVDLLLMQTIDVSTLTLSVCMNEPQLILLTGVF